MKYALIGCGRIATNHIKAVLNNHLEFAAVYRPCCAREQMENLLAKHELNHDASIHRYTDYKEMIEEEQPLNLVGIATESGAARRRSPCTASDHGVQRYHRKTHGHEHCRMQTRSFDAAEENRRKGICLPSEPF